MSVWVPGRKLLSFFFDIWMNAAGRWMLTIKTTSHELSVIWTFKRCPLTAENGQVS